MADAVMHAPSKRRPSPGGMVNLAIVMALLLIIVPLALHAAQPPTPQIAEFAPQVHQPPKQAPPEQASIAGRGPGGAGNGGVVSPPPTPTPQAAPAVLKHHDCVGNPPRQIEDPQSPPCVVWQGTDNGGSSWKGVTPTEIDIANPDTNNGQENNQSEYQAMVNFINARFELYGRKLVLEPVKVSGGTGGTGATVNTASMTADAENVAAMNVFGSLSYSDQNGDEVVYYNTLASKGVMSVNDRPMFRTESDYAQYAPYEWSYLPSGADTAGRFLAEYICKQLQGKPADYAGTGTQGQKRVFGLLTTNHGGITPDTSYLTAGLQSCGVQIADTESAGDGGSGTTIISGFKSKGVTTVIMMCQAGDLIGQVFPYADAQQYFPEWLMTSFNYHDQDLSGDDEPADQAAHEFGLGFRNKNLPIGDMPSTWAVEEGDPTVHVVNGTDAYTLAYYMYPELLLLASGIQMAGPDLTPQTFQKGLFDTIFPNPGAGGPPYYQGHVSFAGGKHSMIDDASIMFWGPGQQSYYSDGGPGAYCYSQHGIRYPLGSFPTAELPPLFKPPPCY